MLIISHFSTGIRHLKKYFFSFLFILSSFLLFAESEPNYANGNGTIIYRDDDEYFIIRKHEQKIKIGDLADEKERIIYAYAENSKVLYTLQNNNEIQIKEIWDSGDIWLKVTFKDITGFIQFDYDPYAAGTWKILEVFDSGDKKWTSRKIDGRVTVWADKDEVELWDKPGKTDAEIIGSIPSSFSNGNGQINLNIQAITEEYDETIGHSRWVKVTYKGKTGWMQDNYLSAERGGPIFETPEAVLEFGLGWY